MAKLQAFFLQFWLFLDMALLLYFFHQSFCQHVQHDLYTQFESHTKGLFFDYSRRVNAQDKQGVGYSKAHRDIC